MIKNLLNADEDPLLEIKVFVEETIINPPAETQTSAPLPIEETSENFETRPVFEIPEDTTFFAKPLETIDETAQVSGLLESNPESLVEPANEEFVNLQSPEIKTVDSSNNSLFDDEKTNDDSAPTIFQSNFKPESSAETVRQSGLAYSAAIILFGSVVFMLVIGWFADLLLRSSPWGIVGGIILGALIGFVQFFRISSQIFKK